jgi:prepilin-type N-terminal cleavage/methylation domain-containing protein
VRGHGGPPREGGFSLLEVLIALAVLVVAISAIIPLFAVGTTSLKRGMDQAQVAWLAPRIAARLQEQLTDSNPQPVKGFVRELEDGSLVIDSLSGRLPPSESRDYWFEAVFKTLPGNARDPLAGTAFHLHVEVRFREEGQGVVETFDTVVLRRLLR